MSPSRTLATGPPQAASGVRWIAAGTLPDAPDMRPSVTSATRAAAVEQQAQRRRQAVQLRHAVAARALEADHGDEVAVELAALEGRQQVLLIVEADRRRLDHVVLAA